MIKKYYLYKIMWLDITGEVDKLLEKIATAEEKMAVMDLHYGEKKIKDIL